MNLGNAIRMCRARRGYSLAEFATRSGVSASHLSLIENGHRDPSMATVAKIAGALSVPVNILVFLAAEKNEIFGLDPDLAAKLARAALDFLSEGANAAENPIPGQPNSPS